MACILGCGAAHRFEHPHRHQVRISVRCRTAIFQVAIPLGRHVTRDAHRGATVGNACPELMHGAGLMQACEPLRESVTVDGNVRVVLRTEDSICNAVWVRPALPTGWSSGTWITAVSWSRSPKEKKATWNSG